MTKQRYLTERDIDYLEDRLKDVFLTKDEFKGFRGDFFQKMDKIVGELEKMRQEMEITNHQLTTYEDRITSLEEIHPQGQHQAI